MRAREREDLPDPFGPMITWISPGFILRFTPFNIFFLPDETCRFCTFNTATVYHKPKGIPIDYLFIKGLKLSRYPNTTPRQKVF